MDMLPGAEKHKILGLLGGSRQDDVSRSAKAAVFPGSSPAPPINPAHELPSGFDASLIETVSVPVSPSEVRRG